MIGKVVRFYLGGFREMTLGRSLWLIIAVKLVVLFGVLKLFFFPDFLETRFDNDTDRGDYVLEQISTRTGTTDPSEEGDPHD